MISASYGADLSIDFGRDVRDIVRSDKYLRLWPEVELRKDAHAADAWRTTAGGIYIATGVGGSLTGHGAHALIIDDPLKNHEEAESPRHREKIWNWYASTALSRLMPGGVIVVVATRWHEDDLMGRLLNEGGWTHHHMKAIETDSEGKEHALWPEWFSLEEMQERREKTPPRIWSALYQGEPTEEVGTYYVREWFEKRYDKTPEGAHVYICSDYAVSEREAGAEPDFTEHGVFGLLGEDIYVLDWWFGQTTSDVWIKELIKLVKRWSPFAVFGEGGVIAKSVEPLRVRLSNEARVYWRQEWITSSHDKAIRGRAMQGMASMGRLVFGRQPWVERIISQACRFPTVVHDDSFDVLSLMGVALDTAHPAIVAAEVKTEKKRHDYGVKDGEERASWKTV